MSGYQRWTLVDVPTLNESNVYDHKLGHIIQGMQQTGFHKWGFVIYRCTYSDDEAWHRFSLHIKQSIIRTLDLYGQQFLLERYLDLKSVEDHQMVENASKTQVRAQFAEWAVAHRAIGQRGPGTETRFAKMIPRYNHCVYVDQKCLDTLLAHEAWDQNGRQGNTPSIVEDLTNLYNRLHFEEQTDGYQTYERPPIVSQGFTSGQESMPL